VNARREFSRSHYSIHPVSVKTIIALSFSLLRKHFIINCRSVLLLCVVLLIFKYASINENIDGEYVIFSKKRNILDLPQLSGKVRNKPGK